MAGTGGKEVGKVSIRVVPDLDEFRNKLRAELEKWERDPRQIKVKADVSDFRSDIENAARGLTAEVDVDAQTGGLRREIERATDGVSSTVDVNARVKSGELAKSLRDQISGAAAKLDVDVTFDESGVRRKAKALVDSLPDGKIDVDTNFRKSALKDISDGLDRIKDRADRALFGDAAKALSAKINAEVDPGSRAQWKAEIQSELAALRGLTFNLEPRVDLAFTERLKARLAPSSVPVSVEPETKTATAKLVAWAAAMRATLKVKVPIVFDNKALAAAAVTARSGLSVLQGAFSSLSKALSRFSPESVIQGLAIVAAVVALAAPAIALLSGALLALPAALAAVTIPLGVIALGLDGIKKAAEVAKPAFEELKAAISDTFANPETGMVKGFEAIRDKLIPAIKVPLQGIAESLSGAFNGVIETLTQGEGLSNLQRTIDNVAAGIRSATPGLQAFTDGLTTLVAKLSGGFPGLGESFSRIGAEFSGWIDKITANGQLDQAMQTLKGTLSEIGGTIKDIAQWGFDNLADPVFGAKIKEFAADLRGIVNDLLPLLKSGFEDIATVISGIKDTIDAIKSVGNFFEKITGGAKRGAEEAQRLVDQKEKWGVLSDFGINDNANVVKWFKALTGQAEVSGTEAGAAAASGLNKELQTGLEQTKKEIQAAIQAPQSIEVGGGVSDGIGPAITGRIDTAITAAKERLVTFQSEFAGQIAQALVPIQEIPSKLNPVFATIAGSFVGAFSALQGVITPLAVGVANSIVSAFDAIPTKLLSSFTLLGAAVGGAMAGVRGVVASSLGGITDAFGQAFAGAAGRVSSALTGVTAAVSQAMAASAQAAATGVTGILQVLQAGLAAAPQVVQAIFGSIPAVVQGAMAPAITAVSTICQQMVSTALAFAGAMQSAGQSIGASFAAGIASSEGLVRGAASALLDAARGFFPSSPAKEGPFSGSGWVDKSGVAVGEAFAGGIQDSVGGVVNIAKVLMQQVKDVFGNAEGVVFNFNFGGVNSGLERTASSLGAVQNQLGSFSSSAQEFQSSFGQGVLPQLSGPESKQQLRDLSQQLAELEIVRKSLELQKVPGADNSLVKAQLEQIRLRKLELGLQKNQLEYSNKYGASQNAITDAYGQQIKDLASMPMDFGRAVGDQFMSDLGFGTGALPTVANELLNWGSQIVFNVGNMDDALQGQRRLQSQQAAGMIGR